jgi:hypothetical protein
LNGNIIGKTQEERGENGKLMGYNKGAMQQMCIVIDDEVQESLINDVPGSYAEAGGLFVNLVDAYGPGDEHGNSWDVPSNGHYNGHAKAYIKDLCNNWAWTTHWGRLQ